VSKTVLIDKDISWDSERLELRLYLQEGYTAEQIVVHPSRIHVHLKNGDRVHQTQFCLPVQVDNKRATLTRKKGVYGETIDIQARRVELNTPQELAG
jgi:hypothetical protein